jgi:hypothetical protein
MGFFSGIRRRIKKLIPKEIRPAIPFIAAAMIPGAGVAGLGPVKSKFLTSAIARGLSDDEADVKDIFRAGALAAAPTAISGGLGDFAQKYGAVGDTAEKATMLTRAADFASKAKEGIEGAGALKTVGAQAATDFGIKQAELNEKALEQYNADLLSRGIRDKAQRRSAIFSIFTSNGYDEDEVNVMLDKYGYADGGKVMAKASMSGGLDKYYDMLEKLKKKKKKRVEKAEGGKIDPRAAGFVATMTDKFVEQGMTLEEAKDAALRIAEEEFEDTSERDEDIRNIGSNLQSAVGGLEKAFGQPLGGRRPEPMRIIPGFAEGGDVDEVMEFDEEIITPEYLMKEEGVPIQEQVSNPNSMDELNSLSLDMFGRPVFELSEEEFEMLKDFASQQALKPGLIDDYRNYKYQMEEQGITPMSPRDYFRNEFGAARLGVAKGGPVEININAGGNNMEDIKGQMAGPDWYQERIENLEFLFGDELTDEEIADIAFDSDKYYEKTGYEPGMKKGGKVIKIMPEGVLYKGKAKDYPGIKQLIKDMKKKGTRNKKAEGGLMSMGGNELDLRGGGFVPMGKKERADDVPARLSKNEFVMTADAVRAAGGGSVQKGADLMYDTMKKLEAQS